MADPRKSRPEGAVVARFEAVPELASHPSVRYLPSADAGTELRRSMTSPLPELPDCKPTRMEVRIHGRGGQGGVSCAKILAAVHARAGLHVQAFGDYGGERSGAPVRAFLRVSPEPIRSRNKVTRPDHLLVLDESLLSEATTAGLAPGGLLLVNSRVGPDVLGERFPSFRVATVDAESIARAHGIGTRSVVIVNTAMVGAAARLLGLSVDEVTDTFAQLGLSHDAQAAIDAYESVEGRSPQVPDVAVADVPAAVAGPEWARALAGPILDVTELRRAGPPTLATGAWSTVRPLHQERLAPCVAACPAGNDVVGFVGALAAGDEQRAAALLARTNPFPGVCGRVCPGFCMQRCNRRELDGAVDVRALERWVSDQGAVQTGGREAGTLPELESPASIRRFVVVGAGPAGLAAGYALRLAGHEVTVVDSAPHAGGLLVAGIPRYRLPLEVVTREIGRIEALGVRLRLGERLTAADIERLGDQHDGLVVAAGLQGLVASRVAGEDLAGIEQALALLGRVAEKKTREQLSGRVVVVGGGNTAVDAARVALRLGASEVVIAYRRAREQMPALAEEVEHALEEGVELRAQRQPVAFLGSDRVRAVVLAETELAEPDASGRRRPITTGRTTELACDHVLLALGAQLDPSLWPAGWTLSRGQFLRDGQPVAAFAAGDHATAAGTVCHAIGSGRRAAAALLATLATRDTLDSADSAELVDERLEAEGFVKLERFDAAPPATTAVVDGRRRVAGFGEVRGGLGDPSEARRCMSCGRCTGCDRCLWFCPDGLIRRTAELDGSARYEVDQTQCKGCGICAVECPHGALSMTREPATWPPSY